MFIGGSSPNSTHVDSDDYLLSTRTATTAVGGTTMAESSRRTVAMSSRSIAHDSPSVTSRRTAKSVRSGRKSLAALASRQDMNGGGEGDDDDDEQEDDGVDGQGLGESMEDMDISTITETPTVSRTNRRPHRPRPSASPLSPRSRPILSQLSTRSARSPDGQLDTLNGDFAADDSPEDDVEEALTESPSVRVAKATAKSSVRQTARPSPQLRKSMAKSRRAAVLEAESSRRSPLEESVDNLEAEQENVEQDFDDQAIEQDFNEDAGYDSPPLDIDNHNASPEQDASEPEPEPEPVKRKKATKSRPPPKQAKKTVRPESDSDSSTPRPRRRATSRAPTEQIVEIPERAHRGRLRSAAERHAPLRYWMGEKPLLSRNTIQASKDPVNVVPELTGWVTKSVPEVEPLAAKRRPAHHRRPAAHRSRADDSASPGPKNKRRKRGNHVVDSDQEPDVQDVRGWDAATEASAIVVDFGSTSSAADGSGPTEILRRIACTQDQVRTKDIPNATFSYQKIFGEDEFFAAGVLNIQVKGEKASKNSRDNAYVSVQFAVSFGWGFFPWLTRCKRQVFHVMRGCVKVTLHRHEFFMSEGGQFFIPRGKSPLFVPAIGLVC